MTAGRRLIAALLAIPTLLTALGLIAVESWRLHGPRSPLFTAPFVFSLADAIETGELLQAYEFLRDSQDPSALIEVRHPALTGGQALGVSPLLWAVATQNRAAVQMLVGLGARMDRGADRKAVCLAHVLGNNDLADLLQTYGAPSDDPCPARDAGAFPLLAIIVNED